MKLKQIQKIASMLRKAATTALKALQWNPLNGYPSTADTYDITDTF